MGFWIFMVIMLLLMPVTMIVFGKHFIKSAPKEINGVFGYRTSMSMKNQHTWEFAHYYCGRLWYTLGVVLLGLVFIMIVVLGKEEDVIGAFAMFIIIIQIVCLVCSVILTEKALKKHFDQYGNQRVFNKQ